MTKKKSVFQFQSPTHSPGFMLWQVSNLWQRRMNAGLRDCGLTHVQFVLLAGIEWLSYSEDHVTQVQLASHAKTDVMMTSNVLRSLEKKGMVTREMHPVDTRAKCITLTAEGRDILLEAIKLVGQIDEGFFSALNDQVSDFNNHLLTLVDKNNGQQ